MNILAWMCCSLLAQMQRFDGLRDRFSGPRARFGFEDAVTAVGAIVALTVVLYLVNRWHSRYSGKQSFNSPKAMFRELCKVHKLDRKTSQLLKRVASWQGLTQPARLFLEPERFEPINLSPELEQHSAELLELRAKLFAFEVTSAAHESSPVAHQSASQRSTQQALGRGAVENGQENNLQNRQHHNRTEAVGAASFASTSFARNADQMETDSQPLSEKL